MSSLSIFAIQSERRKFENPWVKSQKCGPKLMYSDLISKNTKTKEKKFRRQVALKF